jgi:hypothetical protein
MTIQERLWDEEYVPNGYAKMWNDLSDDAMAKKLKLYDLNVIPLVLSEALEALRDFDVRRAHVKLTSLEYMISTVRKNIYHYRSMHDLTKKEKLRLTFIAEQMLIITEVAELMVATLEDDEEGQGKELADIQIRTYNLSTRMGIKNLDHIVEEKHQINKMRKHLHGRII